MIHFLGAAIVLLPWMFFPTNDPTQMNLAINGPKYFLFDMACLILFAWSFTQARPIYTRQNRSAFALLSYLFILIGVNFLYPFYFHSAINVLGMAYSFHIICGILLMYVLLELFMPSDYLRLSKYIKVSALLVAGYGLMQLIGLDPLRCAAVKGPESSQILTALLGRSCNFACFLAVCSPFFFNPRGFYGWAALMAVILALGAAGAVLPVIGVLVGFCLHETLKSDLKRKWWVFWGILVGVGAVLAVIPGPEKIVNMFHGRLGVWSTLYAHLKESPLFGNGFGCIVNWHTLYNNTVIWCADNDYLEVLLTTGAAGLFFLTQIVFGGIEDHLNNRHEIAIPYFCSFVIFSILMIGHPVLELAPIAILGLISFCAKEM